MPVTSKDARPEAPRRGQSGLTTLEWLLIVAAVAGLAALAVVLVQNVVDETAEEISGSNARITAAQVAAVRITSDARSELPAKEGSYAKVTHEANQKSKQSEVNSDFGSKCKRLEITYSDAGVESRWWDAKLSAATQGTTSDEPSTPTGKITNDKDDHTTPRPKRALCEIKTS